MNRAARSPRALRRSDERGNSLIGLLVVILIIAVGVAFYVGRRAKNPTPTRPGGPTTTLGQSLEKGTEVDCSNNLRQIRTAIFMKMNDQENPVPPPDLASLRNENIGPTMLLCPVTQQAYQYNSQTGQVWCPTPGHEKF